MSEELISKGEAAKILESAETKFLGNKEYEYNMGGTGAKDENANGIPEIDCSHLVYESLLKAGINIPYSHVKTSALNSKVADIYYGTVQPEEVTPGDLIVFYKHVGIVKSIYSDAKTGNMRGTFVHSEGYSGGPTTTGFYIDPELTRAGYNEYYYGTKKKPITKFLRPKKEPDKKSEEKQQPKKETKTTKNPEGARQNTQMMVVCTSPDVCKTPRGSSTPEVPYQIVGNFGDSVSVSPNVRFTGNPVYMLDQSVIPKVTGDEPGTKGGVQSGTYVSTCEPVEGCKKFRVNGKQVIAHGDKFKMNNGNTFGKAVIQVNAAPASNTAEQDIYDEQIQFIDENTGKPLAGYEYMLETESGKIIEGRTDDNGYTMRIRTDKAEELYLVEEA